MDGTFGIKIGITQNALSLLFLAFIFQNRRIKVFVFDEKAVFGGFLFYFDDFVAFVCYRGF